MAAGDDMLRALGSGLSGVRPAGADRPGAAPAPGVELAGFADLLAKARAGAISSGLEVTVAPEAGVALTHEQLGRLAQAGDRAEAAGIQRALVMIDGLALLMDVKTRTITGRADVSSGLVPGIDGMVNVPDAATQGPALGPPGAMLPGNSSLAKLLGRDDVPPRREDAA